MTTFPDAPDFAPGSEPWRRKAEESDADYEKRIGILEKNLRSLMRSTSAANKAISQRISRLTGPVIPPGTPINVEVYPYAYFTSSGYPAAGANIYWGDQNDADKYEIWVGPVTVEDAPGNGVMQQVQSTATATADVKGLECRTDYELMIRAVAYGGSYGNFTGTVPFTTPDELTMIPSLGDPYPEFFGNYASVEWEFEDNYVPEVIDETEGFITSGDSIPTEDVSSKADIQAAVLAPNGFIYAPPASGGNGFILNPDPIHSGIDWAVTSFGLGTFGDDVFDYAGQGAVGGDGNLYWVARSSGEIAGDYSTTNGALICIEPHPVEQDYLGATLTLIEDGAQWGGIALAANGNLYAAPINPSLHSFLVIDSTGAVNITSLSYTANETYGRGVTANNGDVWFMPAGSTDHFLVIDGALGTVSTVPLDYTGFDSGQNNLYSPVLHPDGAIYAFGAATWYKIDAEGTQSHGAMLPGTLMRAAAVGSDGKIRGMAAGSSSSNFYWLFDPETEVTTTEDLPAGNWSLQSFTADDDGRVMVINDTETMPGIVSYRFIQVNPGTTETTPSSGSVDIPNYFKHMIVERQGASGWQKVGVLAAPGFCLDPRVEAGKTYNYRMVPVSTAGTRGVPSAVVALNT